MGEENAYLYRTGLYLAASASAEFFADIALSPMEAVKVRIQTMPGFPATLRAGAPIIFRYWTIELLILKWLLIKIIVCMQRWGYQRILQEFGPLVDASNPLHHDEIRLLRKDSRASVQVSSDCISTLQCIGLIKRFFILDTLYRSPATSAARASNWLWHSPLVTSLVSSAPSSRIRPTLSSRRWTLPRDRLLARPWRNLDSWVSGKALLLGSSWSVPWLPLSGSSTTPSRCGSVSPAHPHLRCQRASRGNWQLPRIRDLTVQFT